MQLIRGMYNVKMPFTGTALTIGNFDGVHLGHQAVLSHLREKANALNLPTVVMLFEPQPREYFTPNQAPARLMRLRDKLHYLAKMGVDYVICIRFNQAFAALTADEFVALLVQKLRVRFLSVGDDFRFGAHRQGDFAYLQQAGQTFGFQVEDNPSFNLNGERVSSTAIRHALAQGDLEHAACLLGRTYSLQGRIVHGNKLGRTIGFPTANVMLHRKVVPLKGVFAVKVRLKSGEILTGVANLGNRPTINGVTPLLEVHLFDFNRDIYGQTIEVMLCHKIRDEIKFPSFEALKAQITQDAKTARLYFRPAR